MRTSASLLRRRTNGVWGDHGFLTEAALPLAGAVSSAAAWPIRGAWWEGKSAGRKGRIRVKREQRATRRSRVGVVRRERT